MTPVDAVDRYRRLQTAMRAAGVDAVLLSRWTHGFAVSGARRVQVGGSGAGAPWVIVACGAQAPHVFTPDPDGLPDWIPAPNRHPLQWNPEALADAVQALIEIRTGGGRARCLAYDVLSVSMLERLGRRLPGARFEDVQPLLAEVRRSKSDTETAALREAHDKAARAAAAAGAALRPGGGRADVEAAAYEQMARDGIGFPLAEIEVRVVPSSQTPASGRESRFTVGARLVVDVMVSDAGVCGRALRTFVCGRDPTVDEEALGRCWRGAVEEIASVLRPGCRVQQLRDAIDATVAAPDGGVASVELLVHGVGIGIEPPFARLASAGGIRAPAHAAEAGLAEGAVLLVAPRVVRTDAGEMWASETMAVTRDGGRVLGVRWRPWSAA
jgi:Xaa-Pro aminopeptidase